MNLFIWSHQVTWSWPLGWQHLNSFKMVSGQCNPEILVATVLSGKRDLFFSHHQWHLPRLSTFLPPLNVRWAPLLHKSHQSQAAGKFLLGPGVALKEITSIRTSVKEAIHTKDTVYFSSFSASLILVLPVTFQMWYSVQVNSCLYRKASEKVAK